MAVYDVMSYGAIGDGVADDTAALQAAINAASAAGGGIVYLPSAAYLITSALTVKSYVTMRGEGMASTVIRQSTTSSSALYGVNLEFVKIEDLMLDGPNSGTGAGMYFTGSGSGIYVFYLSVRNVMVRRFGSDGIRVKDPVMCDFINVTSKENRSAGFYLSDGGTSCSFQSCFAHHNGNGFRFDDMHYCALDACGADNNINGYKLEGCTTFTLNGCGNEANSVDGAQITAGTDSVTLNSFYTNSPGSRCISVVGGSKNVLIANAKLGGNPGTATSFIRTDSTAASVAILNRSSVLGDSLASGTSRML